MKDSNKILIDSLKELDKKITDESNEVLNNHKCSSDWLYHWNNTRQNILYNRIVSIIINNDFEYSFIHILNNRIHRYINYFDIVKEEPSADIISYITSIYTQLLLQLKGGIKNENN